jgi:hypothetical protein
MTVMTERRITAGSDFHYLVKGARSAPDPAGHRPG